MDPNANLVEQRALRRRLMEAEKFPDEMSLTELQAYARDAAQLVDLVEALDEWLSKQGMFPDAWLP